MTACQPEPGGGQHHSQTESQPASFHSHNAPSTSSHIQPTLHTAVSTCQDSALLLSPHKLT